MKKIKILLVDDHELMRRGVKDAIVIDQQFEIVDEADSSEEALLKMEEADLDVDVLITDISMSGATGIDLCRKVQARNSGTKVLILSMHKDSVYVVKAFEAGAMGYLSKDVVDSELQEAIRTIHGGDRYLNDFSSKILANHYVGGSTQEEDLTPRELEILKMIVDGLSNKQIAAQLIISDRTVDTHRTNIMRKLHASNTADIVRIALTRKLF